MSDAHRRPNPPRRYRAVFLGPLPVEVINRALGTELEPGNVRLSAIAHRHMAKDHPEDYEACITALAGAIASPTFVGQAPKHTRNFEIVKRTPRPDRKAVLVGISIEIDEAGEYRVRTCYLVEPGKVDTRRANGTLRQVLP
jgi:hypothetical protein